MPTLDEFRHAFVAEVRDCTGLDVAAPLAAQIVDGVWQTEARLADDLSGHALLAAHRSAIEAQRALVAFLEDACPAAAFGDLQPAFLVNRVDTAEGFELSFQLLSVKQTYVRLKPPLDRVEARLRDLGALLRRTPETDKRRATEGCRFTIAGAPISTLSLVVSAQGDPDGACRYAITVFAIMAMVRTGLVLPEHLVIKSVQIEVPDSVPESIESMLALVRGDAATGS